MSETIGRVLFNRRNGKLAVGIRLRFMDKYQSEPISAFGDAYEMRIEPTGVDAWAIDNEQGIYVVVPTDLLGDVEDWGPL